MNKMTGYILYKNHVAMQHENAFKVFSDFIHNVKPERVLEIGTADGGLTLAIRDMLNANKLFSSSVRSFDVNSRPSYDSLRDENIEIIVENIFDDTYSSIINTELIIPFIQQPGTTLVLCDGGYKVGEFNLLSAYIKDGDYIMAHDYIDTEENFMLNYYNKIWNWQEIKEVDICEACSKYQLVDFNKESFNSVVWTCKRKQFILS
jgi:hypothetical protein